MPLVLTEKIDSRRTTTGDNAAVERVYLLAGTSDDVVARAHVETNTPTTYGDLARQSIQLDPEWVDTTTDNGRWVATVRYGVRPESIFTFDTGGGNQHITQSLATIGSYAASGSPPDFRGAIGVTHDNVEGVDITVPVYQFSEIHRIPGEWITPQYKRTLFDLTGTVNDALFKGLAAGECLFLGASGSKRGTDDWEIAYRFAASLNRTGLSVGSITGINKKGWEYLWVRYADAEDLNARVLVKRPIAAYVEKVYPYGNFALLNIGT